MSTIKQRLWGGIGVLLGLAAIAGFWFVLFRVLRLWIESFFCHPTWVD